MTKIWMAALAALTLAACEEQPRQSDLWGPIPPPQTDPAPPKAQDTAFMQGEWRLATLSDAAPPEGAHPIPITITGDRIEARSQCKRFAWTYTFTDAGFDATRTALGEAECDRKFSLWELAFEEAINRANTAEMEMDGGLLLKGPGGQAKLKR
jgi:hypothetical protein